MKTSRKLHTVIGLSSAAFLLVIAVTGTLLTFRRSLRPPIPKPSATDQGPRVSLETILDRAQRAGGARVRVLEIPDRPSDLYRATLSDRNDTQIYLLADGQVVARRTGRGFTQWLFDLHTGAIGGRVGELWNVVVAVALCLSIATGALSLPRRKRK